MNILAILLVLNKDFSLQTTLTIKYNFKTTCF